MHTIKIWSKSFFKRFDKKPIIRFLKVIDWLQVSAIILHNDSFYISHLLHCGGDGEGGGGDDGDGDGGAITSASRVNNKATREKENRAGI